jgi:hypothetical protein
MHMHVHCLHTQQGMKLHRNPPRATYDAVPVRSRPASGDIHECYAMQYDANDMMQPQKYLPHMPHTSTIVIHSTYLMTIDK